MLPIEYNCDLYLHRDIGHVAAVASFHPAVKRGPAAMIATSPSQIIHCKEMMFKSADVGSTLYFLDVDKV